MIVSGTTSTEPSEVESKVKLPKATGPLPGSATWSSTSAPSKSSRSHFSPAVNLSSPAGRVTRAALAPPGQAVTVPDPGHARRFREQCHQVAGVGDLDSARGKPFRRPLAAGALGECHASQLYVAACHCRVARDG